MSDVPVRLLRETLRGDAATAPSPACLDAERLAAWSDGALSAADRAAAESHAAGCARCQAMLAAMAITAPPASATKWWRVGTYKWLVPLAAGAGAVLLWAVVPRTTVPLKPDTPEATVRLKPDTTEPTVRLKPDPTDPTLTLKPDTTEATARMKPDTKEATARRKRGITDPTVRLKPDTTEAAPSTPIRVDAFASSAAPPAPPLPAAPPQPPAAPQAAADAIAPLAEAAGAASNSTESVQLRRERGAPAQALAKTSAAAPDIVSPDRAVRWRIKTAGSVDRSTDGGLTWQAQATGVATPLVSGAAPSPAICWVVGRGGVVLRSTDGATWQRVGLSDAIDLIAIRASDAMTATVTAADGRRFTTDDGGKTWRPM